MHIAPSANVGSLLFEISLVLFHKQEAILEISAVFFGTEREILRHEWRIDADEMRAV